MNLLYAVLVAPFVDMASQPLFFVEVVLGGSRPASCTRWWPWASC